MTKIQYIKLLTQAKQKTTDDFFAWLVESPNFIDLSPIEIEINFLLYSVAFDAYCVAAFEYGNEH
jgi:hypothetical protein